MDLINLLLTTGSIATGTRLARFGFTRDHLARRVRSGQIDRIRPGVFCLPDLPTPVRIAAAHGGMLTCSTLLRAVRVWVLPKDDRIHVWMGLKGHQHPHPDCKCVAHWFPGKAGLGSASVELALVHLRKCAGDLAFFASLESAWAKGMLSAQARNRIRHQLPASKRWLVDRAQGNAGSGLESILRMLLMAAGLRLRGQVQVTRVGRVDFLVAGPRGGRIIVEVDGYEFHSSREQFTEDRRRQAAASVQGLETLNFSYQQVLNDWPTVLASIRAGLTRARDAA